MSQRRRRPRALTLTLPDAERPYLRLDGTEYLLRNLSEDGIGLWIPSPPPRELVPGVRLSGDLVIDHEIHPVELQCAHLSERMVGLRIVHQSDALARIFRRMLEPSTYAERLIVHPQSGQMDAVSGGTCLWYHCGSEAELLIWYAEAQRMILGIQLAWLGAFVSRDRTQPPLTGHLHRGVEKLRGLRLTREDLLVAHDQPDPNLLSRAAQFLTSVPLPLPGTLLWQFLESGECLYLPERTFLQIEKAS